MIIAWFFSAAFFRNILTTILSHTWSPVPLQFIFEALSKIPATPILDSAGLQDRSNVKTVFVAHLTTKMLSCIRNLLKREISQDVCNVPCPIKRNNDLNKLV